MKGSRGTNQGFWAKIRRLLDWEPFQPMLEQLYAELRALGVQAKWTEHIPPGDKFRVLDISGSPVGWVSVKIPASGDDPITVEFGIPDSRRLPPIEVQSKWKQTFPIFGRISDVHWEGDDGSTGIVQRLTSDDTIKTSIMYSCEVTVQSRPEHECWLIVQKRLSWNSPLYKAHQWRCYEKIAEILLATTIPS
ncbi:MAG: hypothetical protein HYX81_04730 [Chloroflexi bacterium]|nr:hypothetical protein [Chloroflexota bacterium]